MGEANSPSDVHVGYDISPLWRVRFIILITRLTACGNKFKFNSLEWRNIVTHGQLKENLYIHENIIFSNHDIKWIHRILLYTLNVT